jgi:DNA-binding IclR family transcriptional regulator
MNSVASHKEHVKSSARTLDILETVSLMPNGGTLTEISRELDIPLSSLHGLIGTMVDKGYLTSYGERGRYFLGGKVASLVAAYHSQLDLPSLVATQMDLLAQRSGETISLSILRGSEIIFIDKRAGAGLVQVVNPVGTRLPAHATGSGKVMLAYLPPDQIARLYPEENLPVLTPATISARSRLLETLEVVRQQGFALDESESDEAVWAVAACIRDSQGTPVGALSMVAPAFRVGDEHLHEWPHWVTDAAHQVSLTLGFEADA